MYQTNAEGAVGVDPLVLAACDIISEKGVADASTRLIASRANVSAALITQRHGGLAGLIAAAFDHAIALNSQMWRGLAHRAPDHGLSPGQLGLLMAGVVRETVQRHAGIASMQRIHMQHALRGADAGAAERWLAPAADVWKRFVSGARPDVSGLDDADWRLMAHLMTSIGQGYLVEGASLEVDLWCSDVCRRLADRMCGGYPQDGGDSIWRRHLEGLGGAAGREDANPRKAQIIAAAAQLIIETGLEGVTHRAVAARAGAPLASTTRHFDSLAQIVEHACASIYRTAQQSAAEHPFRAASVNDMLDLMGSPMAGSAEKMFGAMVSTQEIVSAISRTPAARPLALSMLARVGQSSAHYLKDAQVQGGFDRVDGFIFSSLSHAAAYCQMVQRGPAFEPVHAAEALRPLANWLFRAGAPDVACA